MGAVPLMPKATAVWLVENTALSFDQVADFCKLHPLEVKAIADGEAAQGIKGMDPVMTGQLSRDEIARAEKDPNHRLKLQDPKVRVPESKRKAPRYTPLSKRQDRPNAILWLVRNHPELKDAQVSRLVGTSRSVKAAGSSVSPTGCGCSRPREARLTSMSRSICEARPSVTGSIGCRLAEFQCLRSRICSIVDLVVPTRREICASFSSAWLRTSQRMAFGRSWRLDSGV